MIFLLLSSVSHGQESRDLPMTFIVSENFLYAEGTISRETLEVFKVILETKNLYNKTIILNSPGGEILSSMEFGRLIKKLNMNTVVGKIQNGKLESANCESMCPFVFMAGKKRILFDNSKLGVHQIWIGSKRLSPSNYSYDEKEMQIIQINIAKLIDYSYEMINNSYIVSIMLKINTQRVYYLNKQDIKKLNIINE